MDLLRDNLGLMNSVRWFYTTYWCMVPSVNGKCIANDCPVATFHTETIQIVFNDVNNAFSNVRWSLWPNKQVFSKFCSICSFITHDDVIVVTWIPCNLRPKQAFTILFKFKYTIINIIVYRYLILACYFRLPYFWR